jgi:YVTN family beta-propeller protein
MGVVYRAYDPRLKRNVALKLLAPQLAEDERFRKRFLAESELAASLDHPNVIPIYEAGEAEGVLFVSMRYVDGKDLKTLLREEGALDPARALAVVSQIADALDAAHERGLVHRDVKPSNVLLDRREHVYLADFGLTRRLSEQAPGFEAGLSLGTPAYVAPEQIEGKELDGKADQYSLCCLLHECLTGTPPFPRSSEAAVLFAHLEEEPPAPERLREVMARGLAKAPADRYPSCGELVQATREALGIAEPKRVRWPFLVAGVGAALLAAAVLAFIVSQRGSSGAVTVTGNAVAEIDPESNKVVTQVPVGARPEAIAYGSGSLWVANLDDQTVSRVDPTGGRVVRTLAMGSKPTSLAASGREVWVVGSRANQDSVAVSPIDPQFDVVGPATRLPTVTSGGGASVATRGNAIWVAPSFGLLSRLDPRTRRVVQKIDPSAGVAAVAVGPDAVWVTDTWANAVTSVDSRGALTHIAVGHGPRGIAVGAGAVWVADSLDDDVVRIDPDTRRVTTKIPAGETPTGIAVGAGSVWVANSQDGTVTRIDPSTGTVLKTIDVGGSPQQIAVAGGHVWVTVQREPIGSEATASSGGTARLDQERDWDQTMDPALAVNDWRVSYATCAHS